MPSRPKKDGSLPPAGAYPCTQLRGFRAQPNTGWIVSRRCNCGYLPGPPSRLRLCPSDPGSFRMRQPTPDRNGVVHCQNVIKRIQIHGRLPFPFSPERLPELCLRQSPIRHTLIEAAEEAETINRLPTLVSHNPVIEGHRTKKRNIRPAPDRLRKDRIDIREGQDWLHIKNSAKGVQGKENIISLAGVRVEEKRPDPEDCRKGSNVPARGGA
ncbi:hypothetical protein VTI74DRAFT_9681 [Chaetomium olivicolor]